MLNESTQYSSFGLDSRVSRQRPKSPVSSRAKRTSANKGGPEGQKDFWDGMLNKSFHKVRKQPFQLSTYRRLGKSKKTRRKDKSRTIEKMLKTSLDTLPFSRNYISGNRRTRKIFQNALPCKKSRRIRQQNRFNISLKSKLTKSTKSRFKGARPRTPDQGGRGQSSNVRKKENLMAQNRLSLVGREKRLQKGKKVIKRRVETGRNKVVTRRARRVGRVSLKKE